MSIHEIPYPPDFQIDFAAAHEEERRRRAREGVFCISPRNSTFQKCTSRVDGSVFL
jgi:hypothetical protein